MAFIPRTYSDFLNGLDQGFDQSRTVEDETIYSTFTPLVGNDYQNYAPAISQYILFLQENYNNNNPQQLINTGLPDGTIIYDNVNARLIVADSSVSGNYILEPNTQNLESTDLIPQTDNAYSLGTEDDLWESAYITNVFADNINLLDDEGDSVSLSESFSVESEDIIHNGSEKQGLTVAQILSEVAKKVSSAVKLTYLSDDVVGITPLDNNTYIYSGNQPIDLSLTPQDDGERNIISITFIVGSAQNYIDLKIDSSFGDIVGTTRDTVRIKGGCTITKIYETDTSDPTWLVVGEYDVI